ncbi:MAG TPA: ATP-binding cassette domain-containing protein [Terriglobia bacterium]|nr:ATP-binding cassette domain-containing protein [Terriglobia bacterium]
MNCGVEIRDLRKTFALTRWQGLRRRVTTVTAVDGITLDVPGGQSVAFIGPNGAGKSTTIKMLTGILHPSGGTVKVAGFTPWIERRKLAQHIGAVFGQRSQLWYHLPPRDTFELIARIYGLERGAFNQTRDALVDRFALSSFMDTPVRKLSLGQRMRAEVAASLLHRPQIVFLDEPTIGLDAIARQELRDLVREWNVKEGVTVFLTSHDAGDIEHVASRVVVINHGRVVVDGAVTEVRRRYVNTRILRAQFQDLPRAVDVPGSVMRSQSAYEWVMEIDVSVTPVHDAIARLVEAGPVADVSVEDPPLERVITRIYREHAP